MRGEQEAEVLEVSAVSIHGVPYVDVTLRFADGRTDHSRLGAEAVPDGLERGEPVLATKVANIVISLSRPAAEG
jgi:hypothetical protein